MCKVNGIMNIIYAYKDNPIYSQNMTSTMVTAHL